MVGKQLEFDFSDIPHCKKCETCHMDFKTCGGAACCCCSNYAEVEWTEERQYYHSWCKLRKMRVDLESPACPRLDAKSVFDN